MEEKKIFNQDSLERFESAKILKGNPNGILNFNRTPHAFARVIYNKMCSRTWFPEHINISKDKINYSILTKEEKNAYDLVLAQLITNDSIQTNQLMDKINSYITSPIVNAALARQAAEEVIHSYAYSVMAEDICCDTDKIYNMHHHDEELRRKNYVVQNMYSSVYKDGDILDEKDVLLAFVANQVLEGLIFPGGFSVILTLETKLPGSAEMIKEINKDETLSHFPLFSNIFKACIKEEFNNVIPADVITKASKLIHDVSEAEKRWLTYVTDGLMGYTECSIKVFVENKANTICEVLGIPKLYEHSDLPNPIDKILIKSLKGGEQESRTNFFEANATEYSKTELKLDY